MSWTDRAASWVSSITSSHRAQLITAAAVSGVLVGSGILGFQAANRQARMARLKWSIDPDTEEHDSVADQISDYQASHHAASTANKSTAPTNTTHTFPQQTTPIDPEEARFSSLATRARQGDYSDELILEQLARNRVFLGDEGLSTLRNSFIVVVGLGGVGSHATAALARSGVSRLRLIDFDQVTLSSLNRHAVATLADVGTPKVHCLRRRLEQVTPWVNFECVNEMFRLSSASAQLDRWKGEGGEGQKPDFVIDAIDNLESKVELLKYCHDHGLPVISSMGAGCKSDPTRVFIADISASTDDPLSRSTRRRLKIAGVTSGIPVVFSAEKTAPGKATLMPLAEEEFAKGKVDELGVLPDFRVRILPVLGTMPAVFGLAAANYVLLALTGYPRAEVLGKGREKMYEGILATLQGCEERLARARGEDVTGLRLPITVDDVGYLIEEVYRGKSVVSGLPTRLVLVRWRRREGGTVDTTYDKQKAARLELRELVCMTKEEAALHEKEVLKGDRTPEDIYEPAVLELVQKRMEEESHYAQFR